MTQKITHLIAIFILTTLSAVASDYNYVPSKGITFSWTMSDEVGTYTIDSYRIYGEVAAIDADTHYAQLDMPWSLVSNATYYAYAPYDTRYVEDSHPITALPISYLSQTQSRNGSLGHLPAFDFRMARYATTETEAHIALAHLGSILRIEWPMRSAMKPTALTLSSDGTPFATTAVMNLPEQTVTPTATADAVTLTLSNIELAGGETLVAYIMLPPTDLKGARLTLTLTAADGHTATAHLTGDTLLPGMTYPVTIGGGATETTPALNAAAASPATPTSLVSSLASPIVTAPDFPTDPDHVITFDPAAGIEETAAGQQQGLHSGSNSTYNIAGQRISHIHKKGIYIKDGKKILH